MKLPKLVTFDYGGTLFYETYSSPSEGLRLMYDKAVVKGKGKELEAVLPFFEKMDSSISAHTGDGVLEVLSWQLLGTTVKYAGWELNCSKEEAELWFWKGSVPKLTPTENIEALLTYLKGRGVKLGVVSNYPLFGETMRKRLAELFGKDYFDFVLTSGDCLFRKPNDIFFQVACSVGGALPSEALHCGDSYSCDVAGAENYGMTAVYFSDEKKKDGNVICVSDWKELINLAEVCEN